MRHGQLLYCRACHIGYPYARGVPLPSVCPQCDYHSEEESIWTVTPPFHLTVNDRRFLRSLKIEPSDE